MALHNHYLGMASHLILLRLSSVALLLRYKYEAVLVL